MSVEGSEGRLTSTKKTKNNFYQNDPNEKSKISRSLSLAQLQRPFLRFGKL